MEPAVGGNEEGAPRHERDSGHPKIAADDLEGMMVSDRPGGEASLMDVETRQPKPAGARSAANTGATTARSPTEREGRTAGGRRAGR